MNKKICCVNDMPGAGKIALAAMIPILSAKGISVTCLPTALVSNTLDFGKFEILDTSDYMDKTIDVWKELGFTFDCISTGFMVNPQQVRLVKRLIQNQKKEDLLVIVDPIMADEGKLYNGMNNENVKIMRELSACADILIPNFTEACFLCDHFFEKDMTIKTANKLIDECRQLGAKSVVITSARLNGHDCVIGYDHLRDDFFTIDFQLIDARFPGTGDIFSAVLISDVLHDVSLHDATFKAMNVVSEMIKENLDKKEKFLGISIEEFIRDGRL
ncbi:pyridoxamine kinase [uncultured Traorella sp.]|uniref:pyridoxamine kinase n=1 Tax=uncultured Traorella sp. TaxID=1929048 RepID=UPI0025D2B8C6|nr:pyridoxamine kinase [uncultured Traorella sp.]